MAKITSKPVIEALRAAGIADDNTRRVVIDIGVNCLPIIYVEKYGDARIIEVVEAIGTVGVRYADAPKAAPEPS